MTKYKRHGKLPEIKFTKELDARWVAMTRNKKVWSWRVPFTQFEIRIYKRVLTRAAKNLGKGIELGVVGKLEGVRFIKTSKK